jgi:hypothetical protein
MNSIKRQLLELSVTVFCIVLYIIVFEIHIKHF